MIGARTLLFFLAVGSLISEDLGRNRYMMLDKPMMQVWWREWVQEVKKDIVDDDNIFEYKIHYRAETLKNPPIEFK